MNSFTRIATLCALGLSASAINLNQQSLNQIEEEIKFQNFVNERVYRQRLQEVYPEHRDLVQTSQDDMDDSDIAAYSADVSTEAEGYQTLSEQEHEQKEKAIKMKKELAEKKKKLKKMEAKKKRQEKARKAAEEKRDRADRVVEQVELSSELEGLGSGSKKGEAPIPMDSSAMNAYSLAVAHVAENSEPDMPTNYGTESEKQESGAAAMTSLADKEIGSLFSRGSKEHLTGASLGIELLQLDAQIKIKDDDDETPASEAAVQTEETEQTQTDTDASAATEEPATTEEAAPEAPPAETATQTEEVEPPAAAAEVPAAEEKAQTAVDNGELQAAAENADASSVEGAKLKFAALQAKMDADLAQVEKTREDQAKNFKMQGDRPEDQLQGLMNARDSLHRMSSFAAKPKQDKVKDMAKKLDIEFTPELMKLGSNENISNALVEIAVNNGKSEAEISAALGAD